MKFEVKKYPGFRELFIKDGPATIETGLMSREECLRLAASLRDAADEIDDGEGKESAS